MFPMFISISSHLKKNVYIRKIYRTSANDFPVFQKYVGRLELATSKEQSIKAVNEGRPLSYKIHFPLPQPIPLLSSLWFNDQFICFGPRGMYTFSKINHALFILFKTNVA